MVAEWNRQDAAEEEWARQAREWAVGNHTKEDPEAIWLKTDANWFNISEDLEEDVQAQIQTQKPTRVVVIGDRNVGKTSFIDRVQDDTVDLDIIEEYKWPDIHFKSFKETLRLARINLAISDLAGSDQ